MGYTVGCNTSPLHSSSPLCQALLEEATEALVRAGDERLSRVVLTWKYGAMAVAVAGDIVGGWQNHVSLVRCTNPSGCKGDTERGEAWREDKWGEGRGGGSTLLGCKGPRQGKGGPPCTCSLFHPSTTTVFLSPPPCHTFLSSSPPGHFFLPLTGLKPGTYYYKFIVDGTWTVDPSAPKVRRAVDRVVRPRDSQLAPCCVHGEDA